MVLFTIDEVKSFLNLDEDYPDEKRLNRLVEQASAFLKEKTGHDFTADTTLDVYATIVAEDWIKMKWYEDTEYKQDYDYSLGINSMVEDLKLKYYANTDTTTSTTN